MTAVPAGNSTRVLRAVVTSYIERGVPVGSAFLCRHSKMGLSPASVRSVMAELEAAGLLAKPHVSAGRVPTEAGYRVYVEHFMKPSGLSARETRAIRGVLDSPLPVADALRRMSQVLGSLSRVASVVVLRGRPGVGKARMDTYVCGVPNIVGKIGDWGTTIPLLSMLERREVLAGALLGAVADGEVTVTIGSRNRPRPMKSCSVITSSYRSGRAHGVIGLIGPLRVEYSRLVALAGVASRELTTHLSRKGGRRQSAE